MPDLIDSCLFYIRDNIKEIVDKSENIPTYKRHLAKRLAKLIPIEMLDALSDSRDQLISRLYKKKLELFFEDQENLLNHCTICNKLFTNHQAKYLLCEDAESLSFIWADGKVGCEHSPD